MAPLASCKGKSSDCPSGAEKKVEEQNGSKIHEWCEKEGPDGDLLKYGLDRYWTTDGKLVASLPYDEGKLDGEVTVSDPSGRVELRQQFVDGKPHGPGLLTLKEAEGSPTTLKMSFEDGRRHGEWIGRHQIGDWQIKVIHRYDRGTVSGAYEVHQDGTRKYFCPYEAGRLHGEAVVDDVKGVFKDGTLVKAKTAKQVKTLMNLCSVDDPPHFQLTEWSKSDVCDSRKEVCDLLLSHLRANSFDAPEAPTVIEDLRTRLGIDGLGNGEPEQVTF